MGETILKNKHTIREELQMKSRHHQQQQQHLGKEFV